MSTPSINRGYELPPPPLTQSHPTGPLSRTQLNFFFTNGYVIVRNLVPPTLLHELRTSIPTIDAASRRNDLYNGLSFRAHLSNQAFHKLATNSPVAAAAAQLTPPTTLPRGVVLVNDAYFRMQGNDIGCGFHVDDPFFWPCPPNAPGPGVNAWVALDHVGPDGGGLTIAPRSHRPDFLDCRDAIKENTCMLAQLDPLKNARLEAIAESPLVNAGDVILLTRWLFHRGNPFREGSLAAARHGVARYSVRYMPADAILNEFVMLDGKFQQKDPVLLNDADPTNFPAVHLQKI